MPLLDRARSAWRNLVHPGRADRELDDELRSYVELLTDEKMKVGMSASHRPPVHAQSAGDQKMSPGCGKPSCEHSNPERLPINAACGMSAPFGGPVVPLV